MGRRSFQISVYPHPDAVATLGGYHAPMLSDALEGFADLLTLASNNLEQQLTQEDWRFLAEALIHTPRQPVSTILSERLAAAVEEAGNRQGLAFSVYGHRPGL